MFKGKKMAGHMVAVRVTTQNIEVVRVDPARGLVLVKGAVPVSAGGWVELRDAIKGHGAADLPLPGMFRTLDALNAPAADPAPVSVEGEEGTEA